MLELADTLKTSGAVKTHKAFYDAIGFKRQNVHNIRTGHQSFQREHIQAACDICGANANWIFGLEPNMFRALKPVNKAVNSLPKTVKKKKKVVRKRLIAKA